MSSSSSSSSPAPLSTPSPPPTSLSTLRSRCRTAFEKQHLTPKVSHQLDSRLHKLSGDDEAKYRTLYRHAIHLLQEDKDGDANMIEKLNTNQEKSDGSLLKQFILRVISRNEETSTVIKEVKFHYDEEDAKKKAAEKMVIDKPLIDAVISAKIFANSHVDDPLSFLLLTLKSFDLFCKGSPNQSYLIQSKKCIQRAIVLAEGRGWTVENYKGKGKENNNNNNINNNNNNNNASNIDDNTQIPSSTSSSPLNMFELLIIKCVVLSMTEDYDDALAIYIFIMKKLSKIEQSDPSSLFSLLHSISTTLFSPFVSHLLLLQRHLSSFTSRRLRHDFSPSSLPHNFDKYRHIADREMVSGGVGALRVGDNGGKGVIFKVIYVVEKEEIRGMNGMNKGSDLIPSTDYPHLHPFFHSLFSTPYSSPTYLAICVDYHGHVFLFSIYNVCGMGQESGVKKDDVILVMDPMVKKVSITAKYSEYSIFYKGNKETTDSGKNNENDNEREKDQNIDGKSDENDKTEGKEQSIDHGQSKGKKKKKGKAKEKEQEDVDPSSSSSSSCPSIDINCSHLLSMDPNLLYINYQHYNRKDIAIFYE